MRLHDLCVWCDSLQQGRAAGDRPRTLPLRPVHFRLQTDITWTTARTFSDDTAAVGCVSEGNDLVADFVNWSGVNHLHMNGSKTKELVSDSWWQSPMNVKGSEIVVGGGVQTPGCSPQQQIWTVPLTLMSCTRRVKVLFNLSVLWSVQDST